MSHDSSLSLVLIMGVLGVALALGWCVASLLAQPSVTLVAIEGASTTNLAIVVFPNLGSEAGLICKPQLRPVTTPKYCEAVSRNPMNKAFTYNDLLRF